MNRVDIERCESIIALMNSIFALNHPESLVFSGGHIFPAEGKIWTKEPEVSSGNLISREWIERERCFYYYLAVGGTPRLSLLFYTQKKEGEEYIALLLGSIGELENLNEVLQTMYQEIKSNRAKTLVVSILLKDARSIS